MFRLVVIHQLVLSLIVGPVLCCCTTAQPGHNANHSSKLISSSEKSQRKHCCGEHSKSPIGGKQTPGDGAPSDPSKCPCKAMLVNVVAVTEIPVGTANLSDLLSTASVSFAVPTILGEIAAAPPSAIRFTDRSSSVSMADLLYAHHRLRC
jgi:hypothetical protein